jgi:peroxidase
MAQAPTTILQEINGLYVALYNRAADNQGINYWCAVLGVTPSAAATTPVTTAQATLLGQQFVATQATYFTAAYGSLSDLQYVQALYGNIGGNAGDATGVQFWYSALQTAESQAGATVQSARAAIAGQFVDSLISIDLTGGAAALGLSTADYTAAQARQAESQNKVSVSQFYANESVMPGGSILAVTSNAPAPGNAALQAAIIAVAGVSNDPATVAQTEAAVVAAVGAGNLNPILALATSNPTLIDGTDNMITDPGLGFGHVISYSIDGTGNNLKHPTLSAAGSDEIRLAPANFAPGTLDTSIDGPSARFISDTIMANDPGNTDPGGHSAYMYAFGQFLDHDMDRNPSQTPNATNTLSIPVPANDLVFTPGSTIDITRGQTDPANGNAVNAVTSVLDLSQIYGSDAVTAASLRNADGTLITSAGNNPPIVNGQFVGGDIRAAENPDLTAIDTLFVREHNYWVAKLHSEQPSLTGDQLYDMARAITTAEYQNITYNEYLPALLGTNALGAYQGYNPNVSTQIFEEFSTAAFRFGHTIVSTTETKIANDGTITAVTDLIAAMSGSTSDNTANGGFDALLRNLGQDFSNQLGVQIASDLLNLFNPGTPGSNFDLGAVDVERARDLGIASLNQTRVALGLDPYQDFSQITSDATLAAKLQQVYGSVDNLDLFVGGLAETPISGSMVGQTFQTIMVEQFDNLRAGDRLYYQNQGFTPEMIQQIQNTTLSDLIMRDTDTTIMQSNAFIATERHASDIASTNPFMPQLVIGIDANNAIISASPGVANTLVAGVGQNQTLIGGGSTDTFVFLGSGHNDMIRGFTHGTDVIAFVGLTQPASFNDLVITTAPNGDAVIHLAGNAIDLVGVAAQSMRPHDFSFN